MHKKQNILSSVWAASSLAMRDCLFYRKPRRYPPEEQTQPDIVTRYGSGILSKLTRMDSH